MKAPWMRIGGLFGSLAVVVAAVSGCAGTLPDFSGLVTQVAPAVVNISTTQRVSDQDPPAQSTPAGDGGNGEASPSPRVYDEQSLGSGFIISRDGYILTNYHVVQDAEKIVVKLSDRRQFSARLIGSDPRSDIALLKIDAHNLPVVRIGDDNDLRVGAWVLAIGSPYGFDHSVTAGIVSAKGRNLDDEEYVPFIQTDVPINPGNSGGPLFNENGEVVGVNSQIYSRTGGYMGLSFAVPIDVAMNAVRQLKKSGHVSRGWLGVMVQDVGRGLAESFGMRLPEGALVDQVTPHSPAARAGFETGDIILSFNGKPVDSSGDLPPLVGATAPGDKVDVEILRHKQQKMLTVQLGTLTDHVAESENGQGANPPDTSYDMLGLRVETLNARQARRLHGGDHGVLISDIQAGPGAEAGLHVGDVVTRVDGHSVASAGQFEHIIRSLPGGKTVALLVQRHGRPLFVAVRLPD